MAEQGFAESIAGLLAVYREKVGSRSETKIPRERNRHLAAGSQ